MAEKDLEPPLRLMMIDRIRSRVFCVDTESRSGASSASVPEEDRHILRTGWGPAEICESMDTVLHPTNQPVNRRLGPPDRSGWTRCSQRVDTSKTRAVPGLSCLNSIKVCPSGWLRISNSPPV